MVAATALNKSLADNLDIVCRLEHDLRYLLGTTESGTLELENTPVGANYRALLPDTMAGRDAWELVRTQRLNHSSMGFMVLPGDDEFRYESGVLARRLHSVRLTEASPVSQPGYLDTTTAIRSLAGQIGEDPEDIARLAAAGELRSLFTRTSDMAPVEARSMTPNSAAAELGRRRDGNRARGMDINRDGRLKLDELREKHEQRKATMELEALRQRNLENRPEVLDLERRRQAHHERMHGSETDGLQADFPRDANGHAIYWHPSHQ